MPFLLVVVLVLVLGYSGDFEDENEKDAVIAEYSDRLSVEINASVSF